VLGRGEQNREAGISLFFFLFSNPKKTSNQALNSNQGLNPTPKNNAPA
jgi:hypothetical protein